MTIRKKPKITSKINFSWEGKEEAIKELDTPHNCTYEIPSSVDGNEIHCIDNLDFLKANQERLKGKVKCIYIDPPYNTGKDFIYKDKIHQKGECKHSKWLSFMYPRLVLARELLREDGVIFISIDDNEQANLRLLMNEIFGEGEFVGVLSVENNPKGRKNSKYISVSNDYCVVYAKDSSNVNSKFDENILKDNLQKDESGRYYTGGKRVLVGESSNEIVKDNKSDKHYSVYYKQESNDIIIKKENEIDDKDLHLIDKGYIRYISANNNNFLENTYTEQKLIELCQSDALIFKENSIYEKDFNTHTRIKSLLKNTKDIDLKTETAGAFLKRLFNTDKPIFDNSKNVGLIKLLLSLCTAPNDLILDFFAGSGTTAQAVMELNFEETQKAEKDGLLAEGKAGGRKFILVQLPEKIAEKAEAFKAGYRVISDITMERVRRAGGKYKGVDVGFKVFEPDAKIETKKEQTQHDLF